MGKTNGSYGRDYGKVVGGNSAKDFPGFKGPATVKKAGARPTKQKPVVEDEPDLGPEPVVSAELQQNLLNVFRDTFPDLLDSNDLKPLLQEVKTALYERDFTRAFGREDYLEAYSVRWSPSRALCYNTILIDIREHLENLSADPNPKSKSRAERPSLCAVSFGGGAAEVVAFGGFARHLLNDSPDESVTRESLGPSEALASMSIAETETVPGETLTEIEAGSNHAVSARQVLDVLLIDCAKWEGVVQKLHTGLLTPPVMAKYASTAAKAANKSLLVSRDLSTKFRVEDVLGLDQLQVDDIVGTKPALLTLLFTLNELYTSSIPKTTAFLLKLTIAAKPGTLLLVVDSPGSYSETTMGTEAKKYPMHWLLNHTLVDTSKVNGVASKPDWEKVVSDESRWFRIPEALRYPISLENMRYQIHLYRRV